MMGSSIANDKISAKIGPPSEIFTSERLDVDSFGNSTFDATPDGRLMISLAEPDAIRTRVVLNWKVDGAD